VLTLLSCTTLSHTYAWSREREELLEREDLLKLNWFKLDRKNCLEKENWKILEIKSLNKRLKRIRIKRLLDCGGIAVIIPIEVVSGVSQDHILTLSLNWDFRLLNVLRRRHEEVLRERLSRYCRGVYTLS